MTGDLNTTFGHRPIYTYGEGSTTSLKAGMGS